MSSPGFKSPTHRSRKELAEQGKKPKRSVILLLSTTSTDYIKERMLLLNNGSLGQKKSLLLRGRESVGRVPHGEIETLETATKPGRKGKTRSTVRKRRIQKG